MYLPCKHEQRNTPSTETAFAMHLLMHGKLTTSQSEFIFWYSHTCRHTNTQKTNTKGRASIPSAINISVISIMDRRASSLHHHYHTHSDIPKVIQTFLWNWNINISAVRLHESWRLSAPTFLQQQTHYRTLVRIFPLFLFSLFWNQFGVFAFPIVQWLVFPIATPLTRPSHCPLSYFPTST